MKLHFGSLTTEMTVYTMMMIWESLCSGTVEKQRKYISTCVHMQKLHTRLMCSIGELSMCTSNSRCQKRQNRMIILTGCILFCVQHAIWWEMVQIQKCARRMFSTKQTQAAVLQARISSCSHKTTRFALLLMYNKYVREQISAL